MQPQLQDGPDATAGFPLELLQPVEVPRVDHERLLTDGVGAHAQGEPHVGIVEVIRRTDAEEVDAIGFGAALELLDVPVEALELREEADIEAIAIENADGIVRIHRGDEPVPRIVNGLQVPRGDEPGDAGHGEIFHAHLFDCSAAFSTPAS